MLVPEGEMISINTRSLRTGLKRSSGKSEAARRGRAPTLPKPSRRRYNFFIANSLYLLNISINTSSMLRPFCVAYPLRCCRS